MGLPADKPGPPGTADGRVPLRAADLSASYGSHPVFRGVSLQLRAGTLTALVGPNGCGKTTLLHTLCAIHPPDAGQVLIDERPVRTLSRRQLAQRISLVPQFARPEFGVTVEETVALGRYPWMGPLASPGPADKAATEDALAAMDLLALRGRPLDTLSGGERQRVNLARALAQATPVLLLDEPVASLDLRYQQETYQRLRDLAGNQGIAILAADHHLNLAAATCDQMLVLHGGAVWGQGPPAEIITAEMIREVFGAQMRVRREPHGMPQCFWIP